LVEKKPWYEDIKDRIRSLKVQLENLDTRETLLQKEVARLVERVNWIIEHRKETERRRFFWVQMALLLVGIAFAAAEFLCRMLGVF